jgi:hypothetical protein
VPALSARAPAPGGRAGRRRVRYVPGVPRPLLLLPTLLGALLPAPWASAAVQGVDPAGDVADTPPAPLGPVGDAPPPGDVVVEEAAPVAVRLLYSPGPWAPSCPAPDDVQQHVEAAFGASVFAEPAAQTLTIVLLGEAGATHPGRARVSVDAAAPSARVGALDVVVAGSCDELVAAAAVAAARALTTSGAATEVNASGGPGGGDPSDRSDPSSADAAQPGTDDPLVAVPPADGATGDDVAPPSSPTTSAPDGLAARWGGALHLGGGLTPEAPIPGLSLGMALRYGWFAGRLEGRVDFRGDEDGDDGAVAALITAAPCVAVPVWDLGDGDSLDVSGCGTATVGAVAVSGRFAGFGPYAGVGGRTGFEGRMADGLTLRVYLQVEAAMVRVRLDAFDGTSFVTPEANVLVGVGVDIPGL